CPSARISKFFEIYYFIYDETKINTQAANDLIEDLIENNLFGNEAIVKHAQNFSQAWTNNPKNIYVVRNTDGADKSNLVQKLFWSELYPKSKKQKNRSSWWDGYQKTGEIKGKSFVLFLAKYIFMTSCKPAEKAFNFGQRNIDDKTSTQCSESDFCGILWDLKYDKCKYTTKKLKKIVQELNKNELEEVIIKDNQVYWCQIFPEYKKYYLQDYSYCKELSDYKQQVHIKVESDDEIELDYDSGSLQLKDQYFEIDNDIEIELSKPDSDNSEYTF
ncbi:13268_t:CDS:2, partial [Dentiscutata heterogama]